MHITIKTENEIKHDCHQTVTRRKNHFLSAYLTKTYIDMFGVRIPASAHFVSKILNCLIYRKLGNIVKPEKPFI